MKDVVLTCCKDEADIIETFVRFYLHAGFDEVYVVDNASEDATPAILVSLMKEGLPVRLMRDQRLGYERYLTEYYHWAGKAAMPRWVFFLDCDEFILFSRGAKDFFAQLDRDVTCLRLRQREMFPRLEQPPDMFLLSRRTEPGFNDTVKYVTRYNPGARVYGGKHLIEAPGQRIVDVAMPFIRHYKYRSIAQAERKERNRIAADGAYSDGDLVRLSAFGVGASRDWIAHCQEAAVLRAWLSVFSPGCPAVVDSDLADWVIGEGSHLLTRWRQSNSVRGEV